MTGFSVPQSPILFKNGTGNPSPTAKCGVSKCICTQILIGCLLVEIPWTHRDYVLTDPHMNDIMTLNSIKNYHALKGQLRNE